MRPAAALFALAAAASCGLPAVDAPDAARPLSRLGFDGPYGAAVLHEQMRLGVDGTRAVTVVLPVTDAHDVDSQPDHVDAVVFVQGGFVQRDRYAWLARHLASRGYAVVLPEYTGWLAFFEPGVTRAAADHLAARLGGRARRWAIAGHSLGGVMASTGFLGDARYAGLVLLASEPNPSDDNAAERRPVLSVLGRRDESEKEEKAREGFARFGGPGFLASVDALTHFAWTDPGRDPTVLRETEKPSPDLATARFEGCYAVDAFLDHVLRGSSLGLDALRGRPALPAGLVVEERR